MSSAPAPAGRSGVAAPPPVAPQPVQANLVERGVVGQYREPLARLVPGPQGNRVVPQPVQANLVERGVFGQYREPLARLVPGPQGNRVVPGSGGKKKSRRRRKTRRRLRINVGRTTTKANKRRFSSSSFQT